ncbi:protein fantom isoform X1 [Silurus asotus]|uniref:Protein fantom isoform X1 n=1 Tax=Silurus asotus TaxID=30991 RepID=A0AAD5ARA2_SILAS|nr:protein fantom isoform X1 [Silurus asotus]
MTIFGYGNIFNYNNKRGVQREGEVNQTTQTAPVLSFTNDYQDQNERLTIKDNVDVIRLKKQLSTERTALLVIKDKFKDLKQGLTVLESNEKVNDPSQELAALQASHAETILELQKTRELLALQHRLNIDLQTEMKIEKERAVREREWNRREVNEKDKLLKNRSLHINSLKAQLRHLTYHPRNYNQIISQQNTWRGMEKALPQMKEGNTMLNQLQDGESLLEINLMGATFTPMGLRLMREQRVVDASGPDLVTFCTYTVLDFEMHSTPLVSGTQPNYGFTSCFVLTENNRTMLETQEVFAHIEVHQSLGGIQFITQGRSSIPLRQAILHKGEKVKGRVNITGSKGEIIGVLEFWVRLFFEEEPKDIHTDSHTAFYWSHTQPEGYRLKVEILSLLFDPASSVALDQSVQQVYVEYRLFGIPTETTETPTSLQKPTEGEEIHFNFSRSTV